MSHKGQIVEIPATSPLYKQDIPQFNSKEKELEWKSHFPKYTLYDGILIGGHNGVEYFSIGQRKGVNSIGGAQEALYVIDINQETNRIFAGAGTQHPGLFSDTFHLDISDLAFEENLESRSNVSIIWEENTETSANANLYIFGQDIYLEFDHLIKKTDIKQPFKILYNNQLIATKIK